MMDFDVISISSGSSSSSPKNLNNSNIGEDEIDLTQEENDNEDVNIEVDITHKEDEDSLFNSKLLAKLDELESNEITNEYKPSDNQNKRIYQLSESEDEPEKDIVKNHERPSKKRLSPDEIDINDLPDCDWLLERMTQKALPETSEELPRKKPKKKETDIVKISKREERILKKTETAQAKAIKKATAESLKLLKPEQCIKYVKALLDVELAHNSYSGELLSAFQAAAMQYSVESQLVPLSVTWIRETPEKRIDDNMQIKTQTSVNQEDQIVIIWSWDKILALIGKQELISHIKGILRLFDHKKSLTLVIYGIEEYFSYQKSKKRDDNKPKRANKASTNFESVPKVTRQELETAIAHLQIHCNCNVRLLEEPQHIGELLTQFTKAIAETPYKLEKHRRENESLNWFAHGDSKKCVKIDKNGVGLARLWHQQLCQFNLSNLDTAEAIAAAYPSPRALVQAYENCKSIPEAEVLLQDIPIRRGAGPLTSVRRIGPEMSKKIHSFLMATEPTALLSDDI